MEKMTTKSQEAWDEILYGENHQLCARCANYQRTNTVSLKLWRFSGAVIFTGFSLITAAAVSSKSYPAAINSIIVGFAVVGALVYERKRTKNAVEAVNGCANKLEQDAKSSGKIFNRETFCAANCPNRPDLLWIKDSSPSTFSHVKAFAKTALNRA